MGYLGEPRTSGSSDNRPIANAMHASGSGDRVKRFLIKAREGKGFTVGVIGGSGE